MLCSLSVKRIPGVYSTTCGQWNKHKFKSNSVIIRRPVGGGNQPALIPFCTVYFVNCDQRQEKIWF